MSTLRLTTISNQSGSSSVPSDTVINGSAKAWVNFNGTGTVAIRASFNVSSITDLGTGDYRINFTSPMVDASYSVNGAVGYGSGTSASTARWLTISSDTVPTASTCRVSTAYANGGIDDCLNICASFFR